MIIKKNANPGSKNSNKELTIKDLRIGSMVKVHLKNDSMGDQGVKVGEVIALFSSHGCAEYKCGKFDVTIACEGLIWAIICTNIMEIVKF